MAGPPSAGDILDKASLAVDPSGGTGDGARLYVAFQDMGAGDPIEVVRSDDGGASWSSPVAVDGGTGEQFAAAAVGQDGRLFVAWMDTGTEGESRLMVAASHDGGETFGTAVAAAVSLINPALPGIYSIPAMPTRGVSPSPELAVTRTGDGTEMVYLTYTDAKPLTPALSPEGRGSEGGLSPEGRGSGDDTDVKLVASADGGLTWSALGSAPVTVNDDDTTRSQFISGLGVDAVDGSVTVAWYDARNDPDNRKVDVYVQRFSAAGVRLAGNIEVTTARSDESEGAAADPNQYGDYLGVAAYGGFVYPAWTDHRFGGAGTEEVFVAVLPWRAAAELQGLGGLTGEAAPVRAGMVGRLVLMFEHPALAPAGVDAEAFDQLAGLVLNPEAVDAVAAVYAAAGSADVDAWSLWNAGANEPASWTDGLAGWAEAYPEAAGALVRGLA